MDRIVDGRLNKKMKILVAFGTRPEAIKMCPVIKELRRRDEVETIVCVTGQHRELLADAMRAFGVSADVDLGLMRGSQTLAYVTSEVLGGMSDVLEKIRPDVVMVHGDTSSAFATALAAFYKGIPVTHVEAGLRTHDVRSPFPEELNRRSIAMMADLHFAPTAYAANNLYEEGISPEVVAVTGNTAVDALKFTVNANFSHPLLNESDGKRLIFLTAHRRESHGRAMEEMLLAVRAIAARFDDVRFICPVHPNPSVREITYKILGECRQVSLCEPLGVVDCHNIISKCHVVLTDSGGLQEEAAALGKPTLIMRNVTERPEGILAGVARLAGTDREQIVATLSAVLSDSIAFESMKSAKSPYGDGNASKRIVDFLLEKIL